MNFELFRSKEFTSSQSIKLFEVFLKADKYIPFLFVSRTKQNYSILVLNHLGKQKAPPDNFSVLWQNTA